MATIPNLLALRESRAPRSSRGSRTAPPTTRNTPDDDVQATDTDAALMRLSAVHAGYLDDAFTERLVGPVAASSAVRKQPIINRGSLLHLV